MIRNSWRRRAASCLLLALAMCLHTEATSGVENTPYGMLLYHGSAFTIDLALLYAMPRLLKGAVCEDMECLFLLSIVANFFGWVGYLFYASPDYYNNFMLGLTLVQFIRLLIVDHDDTDDTNNKRMYLVRGGRGGCAPIHY